MAGRQTNCGCYRGTKRRWQDNLLPRSRTTCRIALRECRRALDLDGYVAARVADALRRELVKQRESFAFETVFSDPVGDKLQFLKETAAAGYTVVLCFIGLDSASASEQRVAMRVSQGGHDVPSEKLVARFPRILVNLKSAVRELPHVLVFDNSDLAEPFRQVAMFDAGVMTYSAQPLPAWLELEL